MVHLTQPLKRDAVLSGYTYKLSWPASAHALYITINDTEQGGRRRPFEIFINSKSLEHHAWTVALTRMISAVFRRGGDVSFVVEELKAIVDPQGGSWLEGRYVPSLIAAIGGVIETHLERIGALDGDVWRSVRKPVTVASGHEASTDAPSQAAHKTSRATGCTAVSPLQRARLHTARGLLGVQRLRPLELLVKSASPAGAVFLRAAAPAAMGQPLDATCAGPYWVHR